MNEYLISQNKTNETVISNNFTNDELQRFSKSDYRWAENRTKHPDVYHPMDFPNSKSDLFLLKRIDFSFITHDSVLKLNDIRTVSVNRILYQHDGIISTTSDIYKQIEHLVLQKYFPDFYYEYKQLQSKIDFLKEKLSSS